MTETTNGAAASGVATQRGQRRGGRGQGLRLERVYTSADVHPSDAVT